MVAMVAGRFDGKVALVTGGAKGIGKAIAQRFREEGAIVCVCGLDDKALGEMKEAGFGIWRVDVSDAARIRAFVDEVYSLYGRIDICVNNAGIYPQASLLDMDERAFDETMNINMKSVFLLSKAVAARMIERRTAGVIINAASFAALIPSAGSGAYAASKAAVCSLTRTFAAELAPFGIRVNGYIPGVVETPLTREIIAKKGELLAAQIAMRRIGRPEEVAAAVAFLASDESSYITGTFIEVTGGKFCVQNPSAPWQQEA
jgi:NAD(P)-dependent dehydrogenase (short-subunit alcohol dehydrogenase family)